MNSPLRYPELNCDATSTQFLRNFKDFKFNCNAFGTWLIVSDLRTRALRARQLHQRKHCTSFFSKLSQAFTTNLQLGRNKWDIITTSLPTASNTHTDGIRNPTFPADRKASSTRKHSFLFNRCHFKSENYRSKVVTHPERNLNAITTHPSYKNNITVTPEALAPGWPEQQPPYVACTEASVSREAYYPVR